MKYIAATKKVTREVEDALHAISLATWNRQRSTIELQSFLTRREAIVEDIDL